ncbi:hypothetical protein scyTo_0009714 [Scyliorhinus torazame]|uniref:Ig-like domain-containing protein n=1 Tax=Scyliorhinus torazame TaxID=75743 RepID=A0A401NS80_SCYTO|nr:hypothetical protein [Scyliorhinus torazame]
MNASHRILVLTLTVCLIQGATAADGWNAEFPQSLSALQGRSVIFNCSFQYPYQEKIPAADITAKWLGAPCEFGSTVFYSNEKNEYTGVELIGDLSQKNCSLHISNVQTTHANCYCFRFEIKGKDNWTEKPCLNLSVYARPGKPIISSSTELVERMNSSLICSSSNVDRKAQASLNWYGIAGQAAGQCKGEAQSTLRSCHSFIPSYQDHNKIVKCSITYRKFPYSDEGNITLDVKYKPYDVNISQAGMSFICMAKANPQAQIIWNYTGNVKPVISDSFNNSTLTLQTTSDICISCQAQNKYGLIRSEQYCFKSTQPSFLPLVITGSVVGVLLLLGIVLLIRRKYFFRESKPEIESEQMFHNEIQHPKQERISVINGEYDNMCMSESPAVNKSAPRGDSADALVYASIQFGKKPAGLDPEHPKTEQAICSSIQQDNQVADSSVYENVEKYTTSSEEASISKKDSEDAILYAGIVFKDNPLQSTKH